MSPEWIKRWRKVSEIGDMIIAKLNNTIDESSGKSSRESSGYCDPRTDNFCAGADLLDDIIEETAKLLSDGWPSLQVLGGLEGIRDHLRNTEDWILDNPPKS